MGDECLQNFKMKNNTCWQRKWEDETQRKTQVIETTLKFVKPQECYYVLLYQKWRGLAVKKYQSNKL